MNARNWHCVNAILRRADRFPLRTCTPMADEYECEHCGEWLDEDGVCEDCDEDD